MSELRTEQVALFKAMWRRGDRVSEIRAEFGLTEWRFRQVREMLCLALRPHGRPRRVDRRANG